MRMSETKEMYTEEEKKRYEEVIRAVSPEGIKDALLKEKEDAEKSLNLLQRKLESIQKSLEKFA